MASSKNIHVEIHDNTEHFKEQLEQKMPSILKVIGQTAEGYAKEDCPVDTGLLRNSLTFALAGESPQLTAYSANSPDESGTIQSGSYDGSMPADERKTLHSVYMGSNVKYAPANEFRDITHKVGKAHFIRDAIQDHKSEYKEIIEAAIKSIPGVN